MSLKAEDILLYTTPFCGYCHMAKSLLTKKGLDFTEFDVSRDPGLRQKISRENGDWPTVPMVLIKGQFIGGFTELAQFSSSGKLDDLM